MTSPILEQISFLDAIPFLSGATGAIVGGIIFRLNATSRARVERAFEMHKEFHGSEFLKLRLECLRLIEADPTKTASEIYAQSPLDGNKLWSLIAFYQRLNVAMKLNEISHDNCGLLFGRVFYYWYFILFETHIGTKSEEASDMRELFERLGKVVSPDLRSRWIMNGQEQTRKIRGPFVSATDAVN